MAKRATRVKSDVQEIVLQTADDVALAIKRIGDLEREQVRLSTLQADEKAAVDEKYTAQIHALKEQVKPLQQAVQAYCESRRDELTNGGKQKTAYFTTGEVQWRAKPPAVKISSVAKVIEAIKNTGFLQFLRVKEEINKEALLADPKTACSINGISIRENEEEFVIKPNDEEIRK
ncbi:host-nuclease inhibitor Gam family protein [Pasteurella multocida]|uniref:host-nuclease inhibitor Gam family protein n=1 Tax=Pasteurella multocida TaxID=747 RepID=UPI00147AD7AD|nr:host-nuclease inhibitor Gam family protein [Pasteurella multocida]NNI07703.1 host-nuclease inhibitor protein Gam [Pasteurella multocida]NNI33445.1 host-nuclease inhibitor protein Gam [Pasteurella multocida]